MSHGLVEQFQRMKVEAGGAASGESAEGVAGAAVGHEKPDRYGMLGLLSVIRMVDENLNTLALGTDLTHLGLNLNAPDNLYETFTSPWADSRVSRTPEYTLPRCYYISPPALKTVFFQKFSDMTLFYIFYHFLTRPSDAPHQELRSSLVKYAYQVCMCVCVCVCVCILAYDVSLTLISDTDVALLSGGRSSYRGGGSTSRTATSGSSAQRAPPTRSCTLIPT